MAASLTALQELASMDAQPFRNLVPSLLNILKQARARSRPHSAIKPEPFSVDWPRTLLHFSLCATSHPIDDASLCR